MFLEGSFYSKGNPLIGGYYIPVRNLWNFHIEKRHITDQERYLYEQTFGETILNDIDFIDWLIEVKLKSYESIHSNREEL